MLLPNNADSAAPSIVFICAIKAPYEQEFLVRRKFTVMLERQGALRFNNVGRHQLFVRAICGENIKKLILLCYRQKYSLQMLSEGFLFFNLMTYTADSINICTSV